MKIALPDAFQSVFLARKLTVSVDNHLTYAIRVRICALRTAARFHASHHARMALKSTVILEMVLYVTFRQAILTPIYVTRSVAQI